MMERRQAEGQHLWYKTTEILVPIMYVCMLVFNAIMMVHNDFSIHKTQAEDAESPLLVKHL